MRSTGGSGSTDQPAVAWHERAANVALGATALVWAGMGLLSSSPLDRWTAPRLTLTALNACVGVLFVRRAAALDPPTVFGLLAALPSILLSGAALKSAPALHAWPIAATIPFAVGGALAIAALATLGRCFAVLPSVRGVVSEGPFRWIRHPAYAGELAMVIACGVARSFSAAAVLALAGIGLVAVRIGVEEQMLSRLPSYRSYQERVPWRLFPGLW